MNANQDLSGYHGYLSRLTSGACEEFKNQNTALLLSHDTLYGDVREQG